MPVVRKLLLAAVASFALAAAAQAPNPTPAPTFDVASVKQNKTEGMKHSNVPRYRKRLLRDRSKRRPYLRRRLLRGDQPAALAIHRLRIQAVRHPGTGPPLQLLRRTQIQGTRLGHRWLRRFSGSIQHRGPRPRKLHHRPDAPMMQALLADRFHLVVHHENRDAPAFSLVLVRPGAPGPNLQPHPPSDTCPTSTPQADQPASPSTPSAVGDLPPLCGIIAHVLSSNNPHSSFGGRGIPLSLLAASLPTMTGMATIPRPVVDQTGLVGLYDFTLHWNWSPDPESVTPPRPSAEPSSVSSALSSSPLTLPSTEYGSTSTTGAEFLAGRRSAHGKAASGVAAH